MHQQLLQVLYITLVLNPYHIISHSVLFVNFLLSLHTMFIYLLLGLALGGLICALVYFFLLKKQSNPDQLSEQLLNKLNEKFPEMLNLANQNLVTSAKLALGAEKQEISTDLTNKKQAIETMVAEIRKQLEDNNKKLETAEQNRIGSFEGLKTTVAQHIQVTQQLSATADTLKKVLSNNQLRGAFGEQVAEDLLKMAGFVSGTDYEKQLASGDSRPDFTIFMPDGSRLNIDAKFPYANLVKMSETEDLSAKDQFKKLFEQDIKNKIKEVSTRNYIDPSAHTVDFVILFIPNEMIFSFIYERFPDLLQDAMSKKVVLAGPFSFTALLRLIRQSYDSFKMQKNIKDVITQIQAFQAEFDKYNQEFEKIGEKLDAASRQYEAVNTTRTRVLVRTMDKIKIDQGIVPENPQLTPWHQLAVSLLFC